MHFFQKRMKLASKSNIVAFLSRSLLSAMIQMVDIPAIAGQRAQVFEKQLRAAD
jgi:hypothetical protein